MMSPTSDPYYVVRDEVQSSLGKLATKKSEWEQLLRSENTAQSSRFQTLHTEIAAELGEIESDLKEVNDSIQVIAANPSKFAVDDSELQSRKDFVRDGRSEIAKVRDAMQRAQSKIEADKRNLLIRQKEDEAKRMEADNDAFLRGEQEEQRLIFQQQDVQLSELQESA